MERNTKTRIWMIAATLFLLGNAGIIWYGLYNEARQRSFNGPFRMLSGVFKLLDKSVKITSELKSNKEAYANFNALFEKDMRKYDKFLHLTEKQKTQVRFFCESLVMTPGEFFGVVLRTKECYSLPRGVVLEFSDPRILELSEFYISLRTTLFDLSSSNPTLKELQHKYRGESDKGKNLLEIMKKAQKNLEGFEQNKILLESRRQVQEKAKVVLKKQREKAKLVEAKQIMKLEHFRPRARV